MTSAAYIRTGAMRERAELQSPTKTPNSRGGSTVVWTLVRELWCQIRPLNASQRLQADRRNAEVTHHIYTRYASDVAPSALRGKRIVNRGTAYDIIGAWSPEERREFVVIEAIEGVAS